MSEKVMLFYSSPKPLSRDNHSRLKISDLADFSFAANAHIVPLAGTEFSYALKDYPIVFLREGEDENIRVTPIALVGLETDNNCFVGNDGKWREGAYVPAFVRRYPFLPAASGEKDELTICIDMECRALNEEEGTPLFNEDGSNSAYLEESIALLQQYRIEMHKTQAFTEELMRLDLLESKSAQIKRPDGTTFTVQDFLMVDETRFAALGADEVFALHQTPYLGWIYAHLLSMSNLPSLTELYFQRKEAL